MIAMGLRRTATVLRLFATPGDFLTSGEDRLPAIFTLHPLQDLVRVLVDQEFCALDTNAAQDFEQYFKEVVLVHGPR
jgi:hypothetical protein